MKLHLDSPFYKAGIVFQAGRNATEDFIPVWTGRNLRVPTFDVIVWASLIFTTLSEMDVKIMIERAAS